MDLLSSKVLCLLGAYYDESPFSEESGLFLAFSRREFGHLKNNKDNKNYETAGQSLDTITCKEFIRKAHRIKRNYSVHSTYFWTE